MKASELEGSELDAWVARALGMRSQRSYDVPFDCGPSDDDTGDVFEPSTRWDHGGPIIEREGIYVVRHPWPNVVAWEAGKEFAGDESGGYTARHIQHGPTPLVAAMRCYVASKFGEDLS